MSSSTPDPDAASERGASPPAALEVAGASYSYGKRKALDNVGSLPSTAPSSAAKHAR